MPVATLLLAALLMAVTAGPLIWTIDPDTLDFSAAGAGPSTEHPLGTDESGRDVLSRLLHGGRVSLAVGLAATAVALGIGTLVGTLAGALRGRTDSLLMRVTDAMLAIPAILLAITALTFLGASTTTLVATIGLTSWMGVSRVVRAELLLVREMPWIEAARALGTPLPSMVRRHWLPHLAPSVIVAASLGTGSALLAESALSYLGLGVQPPAASWGNMLSNAQAHVFSRPLLAVWPGIAILLTVLAVNLIGDALRDRIVDG
ncbi:MAG: ABC transporter permease [Gemmatimonadota bacterium]